MIHVARIDLKDKSLRVEVVKANGKETLQQMVSRVRDQGHRLLAAINGDYFMPDTKLGLPEGIQISEGTILFGPSHHSMFALGEKNRVLIAPTEFEAEMRIGRGKWIPIAGFNLPLGHRKQELGPVIYTARVQPYTPTNIRAREWFIEGLEGGLLVGEECSGTLSGMKTGGGNVIPESGAVVSVITAVPDALASASVGDQVTLRLELPRIKGRVLEAVGGGPQLLHKGKNCIDMQREGFTPGQIAYLHRRKHPRSAIGYDKKQNYLFMVTVEGRKHGSEGMTLDELAQTMRELGCWQAMTLDGGASSAMFVEDMVVMENFDPSGESTARPIANSVTVSLANLGALTTEDSGEEGDESGERPAK